MTEYVRKAHDCLCHPISTNEIDFAGQENTFDIYWKTCAAHADLANNHNLVQPKYALILQTMIIT